MAGATRFLSHVPRCLLYTLPIRIWSSAEPAVLRMSRWGQFEAVVTVSAYWLLDEADFIIFLTAESERDDDDRHCHDDGNSEISHTSAVFQFFAREARLASVVAPSSMCAPLSETWFFLCQRCVLRLAATLGRPPQAIIAMGLVGIARNPS